MFGLSMDEPPNPDDLEAAAARYRRLLDDPLLDAGVRQAVREMLAAAEEAIAKTGRRGEG